MVAAPRPWATPVNGWSDLLGTYAGRTFNHGLYRLHTHDTAELANEAVAALRPDFAGQIACFGYDWLGRQFGIDLRPNRSETVLLAEHGTGEILEIPATFVDFHEAILTEHADAAIAVGFFEAWANARPETLPLRLHQCVGYRVPLFLGGRDELDNLGAIDLWVDWDLAAQLLRGG